MRLAEGQPHATDWLLIQIFTSMYWPFTISPLAVAQFFRRMVLDKYKSRYEERYKEMLAMIPALRYLSIWHHDLMAFAKTFGSTSLSLEKMTLSEPWEISSQELTTLPLNSGSIKKILPATLFWRRLVHEILQFTGSIFCCCKEE